MGLILLIQLRLHLQPQLRLLLVPTFLLLLEVGVVVATWAVVAVREDTVSLLVSL
jgi:hypothetical protein